MKPKKVKNKKKDEIYKLGKIQKIKRKKKA